METLDALIESVSRAITLPIKTVVRVVTGLFDEEGE